MLSQTIQSIQTEGSKRLNDPTRFRNQILVLVLGACTPLSTVAQMPSAPQSTPNEHAAPRRLPPCFDDSSYDNFVSRYLDRPLGTVHADAEPVEMIISSLEGDDSLPEGTMPNWRCSGIAWDGIKITSTGIAYTYFQGESDGSGAPTNLPSDFLSGLQNFLAKLPDDAKRLPPWGHRIIARAASGNTITVRVYDRDRLP